MTEYNNLMYRLVLARAQLTIASNQMMRDHAASMSIEEAINAIDKTVAILSSQCTPGQEGQTNHFLSAAQLPSSL